MRAGACAVQQTLTTEAASVLKHSLSLARRRGHAQVTPLHVAATLLSSRASLLRRACVKSQLPIHHHHSASSSHHPLQCRALELCFNVALNRLPTTPGGPLLHGQPSLSNALIAALKRAQAHQRRGCIEQQQQQQQQAALLTIKVELEQLIISILDDPSVSRVMREAGFSSSSVKNNLEEDFSSSVSSSPSSSLVFQCYSSSGGVFSSPCSPSPSTEIPPHHHHRVRDIIFNPTHFFNNSSPLVSFSNTEKKSGDSACVNKEDLKFVLEMLMMKKRKNSVIVGDSVSTTEGLVSELMGRVERGEVPEELKSTHFIRFHFAPVCLRFMRREDMEMKLSHLKRKVDSISSGGEAAIIIIYAGDLKWTDSESTTNTGGYSPADHLVSEIGRLLTDYSNSNTTTKKVWLMATASYHTYMKCQMKQPPLEIQWSLEPVSLPSAGLGLSLHDSSVHDPEEEENAECMLNCCAECNVNYEKEVALFSSGQQNHFPSWLQSHGSQGCQKDEFVELRRKWNRSCHRQQHGKSHSAYASPYPWWPKQSSLFPDSNTISFVDSNNLPRLTRQHSCNFEVSSGNNGTNKHQPVAEPRLEFLEDTEGKEVMITLAQGTSSFERMINLGDIIKILEENVPWQSEAIPLIVQVLVDPKLIKQETWFLIQGNDFTGKRRLSRAIAEAVCGSTDFLFHLNMRKTDNGVTTSSEFLAGVLRNHDKLVVLVEDVDLADSQFMKFLADRYEAGKLGESSSERKGTLGQAIFILTMDDATGYQDKKTCQNFVIRMNLQVNYTNTNSRTFDPDHKRKAELDSSNSNKNPRIDHGKEDVSSVSIDNGCNNGYRKHKHYSRQSSFNTLDLNIKADEDDEFYEDKPGDYSPISSDLTRETGNDFKNQHGFLLESIQNRFVFNCDPTRDSQMREVILSRIKGSFQKLFGNEHMVYNSVEDMVLEELVVGSSSFLNSLFEKWLKDVFQTSLKTVTIGRKNGINVRLCFGGRGDSILEGGYMESCLPKNIQVSFMD